MRYPPEMTKEWGRHQQSDGYGPLRRCTNLVESVGTTPYVNPVTREVQKPLEVCGGELLPQQVADNTELEELKPIDPFRRGQIIV